MTNSTQHNFRTFTTHLKRTINQMIHMYDHYIDSRITSLTLSSLTLLYISILDISILSAMIYIYMFIYKQSTQKYSKMKENILKTKCIFVDIYGHRQPKKK